MSQSRKHSAAEALTKTLSGMVCSWIFTLTVFHTTPTFALQITLLYAALSWAQSYIIRRIFNRLHSQGSLNTPTSARPSWFPPERVRPSTFRNPASNWRR